MKKISSEDLKALKRVIPHKWRVQSFSKNKAVATCVAYIDSRQLMDLLDEVLGAENWQSDYKEIKGNMYAGIGIKIDSEWVWKWDCGTESKEDKEKGEASDAFKRAGIKWGAGRFLYDLDIQYVDSNAVKTKDNYPYCIDKSSKRIWDLTEYINNNQGKKNKSTEPPKNQEKISSKLPAWVNDKFKVCEIYQDLKEMQEKILGVSPALKKSTEFEALYLSHVERVRSLEKSKKISGEEIYKEMEVSNA